MYSSQLLLSFIDLYLFSKGNMVIPIETATINSQCLLYNSTHHHRRQSNPFRLVCWSITHLPFFSLSWSKKATSILSYLVSKSSLNSSLNHWEDIHGILVSSPTFFHHQTFPMNCLQNTRLLCLVVGDGSLLFKKIFSRLGAQANVKCTP